MEVQVLMLAAVVLEAEELLQVFLLLAEQSLQLLSVAVVAKIQLAQIVPYQVQELLLLLQLLVVRVDEVT